MAKYDLLLNVSAALTGPQPQGQAVKPDGPTNPNMPPLEQAFQLVVAGVGNVTATVQILVSNDTGSVLNWVPYGDPVTAAGSNIGQAAWSGSQPWRHYAANCTNITAGAKATLRMSA